MDLANKVREEVEKGVIGPDEQCEHYPCHFQGQDCSFCYCPLYPCLDPDLGKMVISRKGKEVWSCQDCYYVHRNDVAKDLMAALVLERQVPPDDPTVRKLKADLERAHAKRAQAIMVLGATSGAGKSLITAALCRILSDGGYRVAPFKSQNMSLNSCVTKGGDEIARIQELQARAARAEPIAAMNPILLKPKGNAVSQVIVNGRPYQDMDVQHYYGEFVLGKGLEVIRVAYDELARTNDFVVIEGAGSPAEINLGERDIANMRTAEIANADCILVVNMEWGGAFAYAYGTLKLLPEEHRRRFKGIVLNNMHGDAQCLRPGIEELERRLGIPVLGVVPHIDLTIPMEDSMTIASQCSDEERIRVGVVRLPRISNFTDFEALAIEPGVSIIYVTEPRQLELVEAIILPGTKNTIEDLAWLKEKGLFLAIKQRGGRIPIIGICGGFQMLGAKIIDATGVEGGTPQEVEGLGLLSSVTYFDAYDKRTVQVEGVLLATGERIRGYEIHMGRTESAEKPLLRVSDGKKEYEEGARSADGMVMGTYLHGAFDLPPFRRLLVEKARASPRSLDTELVYQDEVEESLQKLARTVEKAIDLSSVISERKEGV
jgi:adenosylcobyric acid synthase